MKSKPTQKSLLKKLTGLLKQPSEVPAAPSSKLTEPSKSKKTTPSPAQPVSAPPKPYTFVFVHGAVNESLGQEIIDLWNSNQALGIPEEAQRRLSEVACIARNSAGQLVAVNSIYLRDLPNAGGQYYFYRQFTRPEDRRVSLSLRMLRQTLDFLKKRELESTTHPQSAQGVIVVAENVKLLRKAARRSLERSGLSLVGRDNRGVEIWGLRFHS